MHLQCDAQIALQMHQLKHMLIKSNQAYINYTTPMYDQWLTLHWFTQYFIPWRALQSGNAYNAEIILKESKQLAVIIAAIEQIQASKK